MKRDTHFKNVFVLAIVLFPILFLTSCSNYYYSPNDGELITLREKKDIHISGSLNIDGEYDKKSSNIQAGYSPINHLAIAGSYFRTSDGGYESGRYGKGHILNGAIGAYYFFPSGNNPIFKRKRKRTPKHPHLQMKKGVLLDFYVGHGKGKVHNFYPSGGNSVFKFQKNYAQVGVHLFKKNWSLSYTIRQGLLNFQEGIVYNASNLSESELSKFQFLNDNNSFTLMEQSFRFTIGFNRVRYIMTVTGVNETADLMDLGVENTNISVGLIFELDEFFKEFNSSKDNPKEKF